jgi:ribosomal protein S6E (S10)
MADGEFIAVVNDTNPANNGRSYNVTVSGNNHAQFLGKRIGDVVDGIFVGEGETALNGYKLEITGGSDKTGTPMRRDLDGGSRRIQGPQAGPEDQEGRKADLPLRPRRSAPPPQLPWQHRDARHASDQPQGRRGRQQATRGHLRCRRGTGRGVKPERVFEHDRKEGERWHVDSRANLK